LCIVYLFQVIHRNRRRFSYGFFSFFGYLCWCNWCLLLKVCN